MESESRCIRVNTPYLIKVLEALKTAPDSKLILHVGGIYQDKEAAMKRFEENYKLLQNGIKARLVLENDDKSYTISDVLELGLKLGIPVVFDHLHNRINCSDPSKNDSFWIEACKSTWKAIDGRQKIHYSQQEAGKKPGSHSQTIETSEFMKYYKSIRSHDLDVMLEVKDKNLSALKCIHLVASYNFSPKVNRKTPVRMIAPPMREDGSGTSPAMRKPKRLVKNGVTNM